MCLFLHNSSRAGLNKVIHICLFIYKHDGPKWNWLHSFVKEVTWFYFGRWRVSEMKCERTSSVPLKYHYSTTIQKTSRKQRARPYLYSTTIVPLFCSGAPLLIHWILCRARSAYDTQIHKCYIMDNMIAKLSSIWISATIHFAYY